MNGRFLPARQLALLAILVLLPAAGGAQQTAAPRFIERPDEELLLLELHLDDLVLADAVPVFQADTDLFLPLGELARFLSLAIAVRPEEGVAEGFVIEETRRFFLDAASGEVIVGEARFVIRPGTVEIHRDDIYVSSRALAEWLPLTFEANLFTQSLFVTSREPLPIQAKRARRSRTLAAGEFDPSRSPWPPAPQAYSLFTIPAMEAAIAVNSAAGVGVDAARSTTTVYSLRFAGELAYQELDAFLSGADGDAEVGRFTIGRRDPRAQLLGPLHAREVLAGTVWNSGSDLLFAPDFGDGILISNYPLHHESRFDTRNFIGILEAGWDVELYRNGVLFGIRRSRSDGRYEFENVPLLYGLNVFRFVFYGPQGQRREELQRINVGEGLVPVGETWYRAAALDSDRGARNALLELDRGVSERLSLNAAAAWSDQNGTGTAILKAGASTFFSSVALNAVAGVDSAGGTAGQITAHGRFGSAGFLLQHAQLHDYAGRLADATVPNVEQRTLARLDGGWSLRKFAIPWTAEIARNVFPSGEIYWQIHARAGTAWRRSAFSIETDGNRTGDDRDSLFTRVLLSQRLGTRWTTRAGLHFQNLPASELESGEVILERRSASGRYFHLAARHLAATDSNAVAAGAGQSQGPFGATALVSWDDRSGWSLAGNINFSAQWNELRGAAVLSSRSLASYGSIAVLVFIDENANGRFDEGEPPVEGVDFFVNRAGRNQPTDTAGTTLIDLLPVYRELELTISESSIPDPFLRPASGGVRLTPRPGLVEKVIFPLVASGELTGTLLLADDTGTRGYGGIRVQVVRPDGTTGGEAITSFDGYFEILGVAPGGYTVRIAPEQAQLLRLRERGQVEVVIERGETAGAEIVIERR